MQSNIQWCFCLQYRLLSMEFFKKIFRESRYLHRCISICYMRTGSFRYCQELTVSPAVLPLAYKQTDIQSWSTPWNLQNTITLSTGVHSRASLSIPIYQGSRTSAEFPQCIVHGSEDAPRRLPLTGEPVKSAV